MIGRPKGNFLAIQEGSDMDSAIHVRTSRCSVESDNLPARATGLQDTATDEGNAEEGAVTPFENLGLVSRKIMQGLEHRSVRDPRVVKIRS